MSRTLKAAELLTWCQMYPDAFVVIEPIGTQLQIGLDEIEYNLDTNTITLSTC